MGEGNIDLVNLAKAAWKIVEDGKPSGSSKSSFCQAMPSKSQLGWDELGGGKVIGKSWAYKMQSVLDGWLNLEPSVDMEFQWELRYGATTPKGKGLYIEYFKVTCNKCNVDWGWTANAEAAMIGPPANDGTPTAPIASLQVEVSLDYKSMLASRGVKWTFTANAKGAVSVK